MFPVHSFPRTFMHNLHYAARIILASGAALCITACADDTVSTATSPLVTSFASSMGLGGNGFEFTPLSSSFACTVSGGDPVNPVALPAGFAQSILVSEPQVADAIDMNTQNENGPQTGRYLYRPAEGSLRHGSAEPWPQQHQALCVPPRLGKSRSYRVDALGDDAHRGRGERREQ